jgi:hypothetical protein
LPPQMLVISRPTRRAASRSDSPSAHVAIRPTGSNSIRCSVFRSGDFSSTPSCHSREGGNPGWWESGGECATSLRDCRVARLRHSPRNDTSNGTGVCRGAKPLCTPFSSPKIEGAPRWQRGVKGVEDLLHPNEDPSRVSDLTLTPAAGFVPLYPPYISALCAWGVGGGVGARAAVCCPPQDGAGSPPRHFFLPPKNGGQGVDTKVGIAGLRPGSPSQWK